HDQYILAVEHGRLWLEPVRSGRWTWRDSNLLQPWQSGGGEVNEDALWRRVQLWTCAQSAMHRGTDAPAGRHQGPVRADIRGSAKPPAILRSVAPPPRQRSRARASGCGCCRAGSPSPRSGFTSVDGAARGGLSADCTVGRLRLARRAPQTGPGVVWPARKLLQRAGPSTAPRTVAWTTDMTMRPLLIVVLAAGMGTRMRSSRPKVLHAIPGRSMLAHALATARSAGASSLAVVVAPGMEAVRVEAERVAPGIEVFEQASQLGTGHA